MSNVIEVVGIISGTTRNNEKNVITLHIKTDDLTEEKYKKIRESFVKPKVEIKITPNKTHKILGAYKNAY